MDNRLAATLILLSLLTLSACGSNPNRAGCSFVDGEGSGRVGVPFENVQAQGDVKGAHIYIGDNVSEVKITCNAEVQEVKIRRVSE